MRDVRNARGIEMCPKSESASSSQPHCRHFAIGWTAQHSLRHRNHRDGSAFHVEELQTVAVFDAGNNVALNDRADIAGKQVMLGQIDGKDRVLVKRKGHGALQLKRGDRTTNLLQFACIHDQSHARAGPPCPSSPSSKPRSITSPSSMSMATSTPNSGRISSPMTTR